MSKPLSLNASVTDNLIATWRYHYVMLMENINVSGTDLKKTLQNCPYSELRAYTFHSIIIIISHISIYIGQYVVSARPLCCKTCLRELMSYNVIIISCGQHIYSIDYGQYWPDELSKLSL